MTHLDTERADYLLRHHHLVGGFNTRGPFVAFAYEQDRLLQAEPRGVLRLPISYGNLPTDEVNLWNRMLQKLQEIRTENADDVSFSLEGIVAPELKLPNTPAPFVPGILFAIVGVGPKYFEKAYNDSVSAMYAVDDAGTKVLREGLTLKAEPFWSMTNYNFNGNNMSLSRVDNPHLRATLSILKGQLAQAANAPAGI